MALTDSKAQLLQRCPASHSDEDRMIILPEIARSMWFDAHCHALSRGLGLFECMSIVCHRSPCVRL